MDSNHRYPAKFFWPPVDPRAIHLPQYKPAPSRRGPMVRIHLPPAESRVRTRLMGRDRWVFRRFRTRGIRLRKRHPRRGGGAGGLPAVRPSAQPPRGRLHPTPHARDPARIRIRPVARRSARSVLSEPESGRCLPLGAARGVWRLHSAEHLGGYGALLRRRPDTSPHATGRTAASSSFGQRRMAGFCLRSVTRTATASRCSGPWTTPTARRR